MNTKKLFKGIAILVIASVGIVRGSTVPELKLNGGELVFDASGAVSYRAVAGQANLAFGFYAPGWSPRSQWKLGPDRIQFEATGDKEWTWKNKFSQGDGVGGELKQVVRSTEDGVEISYLLTVDSGFRFEEGSRGPFIELVLPAASSDGQSVKIAGKTVALPADNVWAYGDSVVVPSLDLLIQANRGMSLSVWKASKGRGNLVRFALKPNRTEEGNELYEASFTLR
tara:strand:- start:5882 stop:6559 length:678 start_codon:yes stop_codon:yes gene_type:complete